MNTDAGAPTNAHGAVIATAPANKPFAIIVTSGLPHWRQTQQHALRAPAAEASIVFTAMIAMRGSMADSDEPALKPNQPNARMNAPSMAIGTLCPGIARGAPSRPNLPTRG